MKRRVILLRHAEPSQDKGIDAQHWSLSPGGINQSKNLVELDEIQDVDIIFSSPEVKAIETLKPIAKRFNLEPVIIKELSEVKRKDRFLSSQDYSKSVQQFFKDPNSHPSNWESANNALRKFKKGMSQI